ncbi:unnamed protein product [Hydatigera taeniaeformis]|uniref:polynucleotide adenylyltransferase n=1 Tax=Hydatigena taeniaeformis TaxID=6205 RepID=A0A3P7FQP2_HYDTA|nr:unnamed protein product [Hydatigera taeniaeformis]
MDKSPSKLPCDVLIQGSTSLGVSFKKSDLDAVLITPNFVYREDFFTSFAEVLRNNQNIQDLLVITDTFVPLIKMKFSGTSVDLIMSRYKFSYVPSPLNFDEDPELFYLDVDHYSVHGLSGLHLSQKIRDLVPSFPLFTDLLKVIKIWASRRLISDYVYGFPASVAWAVLCAYICMHTTRFSNGNYPYYGLLSPSINAQVGEDRYETVEGPLSHSYAANQPWKSVTPFNLIQILPRGGNSIDRNSRIRLTTLVKIFFAYFSNWVWPSPVMIAPIVVVPKLRLYSWDPRVDIQNGHEIMPIITPIFPHKNAAYTVRPSSRDIVVKELHRGFHLTKKIVEGSATWEDLFEPYDIRHDYRHFLKLELVADNFQELGRLGGLIDSRLRDLAGYLEEHQYIESVRITKASDLPKHFDIKIGPENLPGISECGREKCFNRAWLLGMKILRAAPLPNGTYPERIVDVTQCLQRFYINLQDRDPNTNFLAKLKSSYVSR